MNKKNKVEEIRWNLISEEQGTRKWRKENPLGGSSK